MTRQEVLKELMLERKPHLLEQWRIRGILGHVAKNKDGKYVYTTSHLVRIKKHILALAELKEGTV